MEIPCDLARVGPAAGKCLFFGFQLRAAFCTGHHFTCKATNHDISRLSVCLPESVAKNP